MRLSLILTGIDYNMIRSGMHMIYCMHCRVMQRIVKIHLLWGGGAMLATFIPAGSKKE